MADAATNLVRAAPDTLPSPVEEPAAGEPTFDERPAEQSFEETPGPEWDRPIPLSTYEEAGMTSPEPAAEPVRRQRRRSHATARRCRAGTAATPQNFCAHDRHGQAI